MTMPTVTAILAISDDNVIGKAGKLPWKLPDDMKRFKEATTGHAVIMGRKTYESIGKPLAGRTNIVVSAKGFEDKWNGDVTQKTKLYFAKSPESALKLAFEHDESPFVIGGAKIYRALWNFVDKIVLTRVHTSFGDVTDVTRLENVPNTFVGQHWKGVFESAGFVENGSTGKMHYAFMTFERRTSVPEPLFDDMKPGMPDIFKM